MNRIVITTDVDAGRISRHIYGHFAEHLGRCIYDGLWVGEDSKIPNVRGIRSDIVEALKKIRIPNLRWPGGCFADDYNWMDGSGPREQRPKLVNHHWGRVVEDNAFGTHEFFDFAELIAHAAKSRPLTAGSIIGSGTVSNKLEDGPGKPIADGGVGYSCLAELRTIETLQASAAQSPFMKVGDRVRIEMRDGDGHSIFGSIEQTVVRYRAA